MRFKPMFLIAMFFVALTSAAQTHKAWPESCGSDAVQYKVKTEKKQSPSAAEAGKALIVFIESTEGNFFPLPTARFGVDGNWVGADRGPSYFAYSVTPGLHKLCAARQSGIKADKDVVGVVTVNAEAGKVYYYEFKIMRTVVGSLSRGDGGGAGAGGLLPSTPNMTAREGESVDTVSFNALSDDQVAKLMRTAPVSISTAK
jgi:hypothetical protein